MTVPEDFPRLPIGGSLSGMQLKFSVSRGADGVLREPGLSQADRAEDFLQCNEVLSWAIDFLREKALKPKYSALTGAQMLEKFKVNLDRDFEMPGEYRSWILARLADHLGQR
jgi:hypothetical protein